MQQLDCINTNANTSNTPNTLEALDCISRQDAVDIINGYAEQFNGYIGTPNDSEVYAYARGLLLSIERNISALTSAQPEQKWNPVSKKLPKEDTPVLVTDDAGGMATVGIDSCGRYEDTGERFWYTSQNVTAWMDTVEPYGGEQE